MFLANDIRILVKGFCVTVFVLGIFFPIVTVKITVDSTDNRTESFSDELIVIYTNSLLEAEIDDSNDEVNFKQPRKNDLLTWVFRFLLFMGIGILSLSLLADLREKDEGFVGNWYSTFSGFMMLVILFGLIILKIALLEADLQNENGKSLFERIDTSEGSVSFFVNIEESVLFKIIQGSLLSFILLPISNKFVKKTK